MKRIAPRFLLRDTVFAALVTGYATTTAATPFGVNAHIPNDAVPREVHDAFRQIGDQPGEFPVLAMHPSVARLARACGTSSGSSTVCESGRSAVAGAGDLWTRRRPPVS